MAPAYAKSVTFWRSTWNKANILTGGTAPSSFKGFVNHPPANPVPLQQAGFRGAYLFIFSGLELPVAVKEGQLVASFVAVFPSASAATSALQVLGKNADDTAKSAVVIATPGLGQHAHGIQVTLSACSGSSYVISWQQDNTVRVLVDAGGIARSGRYKPSEESGLPRWICRAIPVSGIDEGRATAQSDYVASQTQSYSGTESAKRAFLLFKASEDMLLGTQAAHVETSGLGHDAVGFRYVHHRPTGDLTGYAYYWRHGSLVLSLFDVGDLRFRDRGHGEGTRPDHEPARRRLTVRCFDAWLVAARAGAVAVAAREPSVRRFEVRGREFDQSQTVDPLCGPVGNGSLVYTAGLEPTPQSHRLDTLRLILLPALRARPECTSRWCEIGGGRDGRRRKAVIGAERVRSYAGNGLSHSGHLGPFGATHRGGSAYHGGRGDAD